MWKISGVRRIRFQGEWSNWEKAEINQAIYQDRESALEEIKKRVIEACERYGKIVGHSYAPDDRWEWYQWEELNVDHATEYRMMVKMV